jgi:hypothetical protein
VKVGDLVTFCPEAWGTPLEDRPLGVITHMQILDEPREHSEYKTILWRWDFENPPIDVNELEIVSESR